MPVSNPLSETFAAALTRLGAPRRVAVACSGGADSTALALLAQEACGEVRAYIVDHGLRADSGAEAALTAQRLVARGMAARILTLSLPTGPALQERARIARYEALAHAAAADGFLHLLLGHHAADQEETVAMRAARGDGGLEGMAAWSARRQVLLLRPLLGVRPEALRAYLQARGMAWVEDPSNQVEKFERVRIRLAGAGQAPRNAAARIAREEAAAAFLAEHAELRPEGFALLHAAAAPAAALGALLRVVGGALYAPRRDAVAALAAQLRPATLGGVRVLPAGRLGAGWLLVREAAACAPQVPAVAGAVWDGRFRLLETRPDHNFGALGADSVASPLPSVVRRVMPALRGPGGAIIFPIPAVFSPPAPLTAHPFGA